MIILDTLRADKLLNIYENKKLTPFINELLKNSYYFENCIANSPWTVPSHINMFTGLYATELKNLTKKVDTLDNKIPVINEILKNLGYYTICYTENPHINKNEGFARGFEIILESWQEYLTNTKRFWLDKIEKIIPISLFLSPFHSFIKKRIDSWDKILFKAIGFLKNFRNWLSWKKLLFNTTTTFDHLEKLNEVLKKNINSKPLYLFLNIMATHYPYIPTRQILNHFKISNKDIKTIRNFLLSIPKDQINLTRVKPLSKKKIAIINKLYCACVFYADQIVKKIFSILDSNGLLENSYVIITSDHGEHLCDESDHFLFEHKTYFSVYESLIKVPLIIYHKNYKNRIIGNQVELKDLFHTILSFSNQKSPNIKYLKREKSILYQIENNSTPKFIFGEYLKPKHKIDELISKYRNNIKSDIIPKIINDVFFLRTEEFKLIDYNSNQELFKIKTDNHEQYNIIHENLEDYKLLKNSYNSFKEVINKGKDLKAVVTEKEKDLINRSIKFL
ncbi:MAG: sulfatase-like hydrolase/transferase [Promethearchaeota archaeon]